MLEELFKPEKTNAELLAEKDTLWTLIEECNYCQQVGSRTGGCSNHLAELKRVEEIDKILKERKDMEEDDRPFTPEENQEHFNQDAEHFL